MSLQTRKSSVIKKWLLLFTRLLLLTAIIIAFAQPYFKAEDSESAANEMVILLDNSFSMQAKGSKGELLKRAIQDILENTPDDKQFSLITNTTVFWDTDVKSVQKELQSLEYSDVAFRPDFLLTKAQAKKPNTTKDIITITDAVNMDSKYLNDLNADASTYFIVPEAENKNNITIDSVYIAQALDNFYEIKVTMQAYGTVEEETPIALYNGNKLQAKTVVNFTEPKQEATFTIPKADFNGYVSVTDNNLAYDNKYYFSITEPEKQNVIAIGETAKNNFLSRIYTTEEYNFTATELSTLDYNILEKQDAVILNELTEIPQSLITTLKSYYDSGLNIVILPNAKSSAQNLNQLLSAFSSTTYSAVKSTEKQVTKIAFSHPLYRTVFEKQISNFQYPKVSAGFTLRGNALPVLTYDDGSLFLASVTNGVGNVYVFAAPVNTDNSNFQNSPLIVPTFINMAQNSNTTGVSAITIGKSESIFIDALLSKDEVVTVRSENSDFIPMQQVLNNKVKLSFGNYPEKAGNYTIYKDNEPLKNISFNYSRNESNLNLQNKAILKEYNIANSVEEVYTDMQSKRTADELWKWFVIATLIFLLLELFIQKFVK
ncbi:membrane protein [Flavobacterium suaedae]|uniref:Membrane protein n=1 Tax=Flavobacterium suaedae TaxID=1767027 RepID=A0ABQ1JHI8_9FLAO|nr:membrane protein [Flavobacterium suaedae]